MSGLTNYTIPSLEEIDRVILKKTLESDLLSFTRHFFEVAKKETFYTNWHHRLLADELMKVYNGETQFLLITIPPRYTKTELAVKNFIAWSLARNPKSKFIHLSYSDGLALENSTGVKDLVESYEYQRLWDVHIRKDMNSKKRWDTEQGGGVYATSTGGQVTGFGAGGQHDEFEGAIIIDDPLKPTDANSEVIRTGINERFNNTIKSRMNNPSHTPIIVIMQRIHEDDMAGYLLNGGSEFQFKHLNLPAINEDGKSDYDPRDVGEALWPQKHSVEQLRAMEVKDNKTYSGQYQQRPAPKDGNIIKKDSLRFYGGNTGNRLPDRFQMKIQSWDLTFKDSKTSDFVVGTSWGYNKDGIYLLDCVRGQYGFSDTLKIMEDFIRRNNDYNAILVEEKANGVAIIEVLKREFTGIVPINPTESKNARFEACSTLFDAGDVWFPHESIAPWINDFTTELLTFPNAKHDDRVDSVSQALNYLGLKRAGAFTKAKNRTNIKTIFPSHKTGGQLW